MGGKKGRKFTSSRLGDTRAMLALVEKLNLSGKSKIESAAMKRQMVADWCRLLGEQINNSGSKRPAVAVVEPAPQAAAIDPGAGLAPRVRQTLARLLAGDSEKQIALHLRVSPHTVHVYVKAIYRSFNVNSRGELLAIFVAPAHRASISLPSRP
jgi:DNA-binding CsgD family transcriptional regulator